MVLDLESARAELTRFAMTFPEAETKAPWPDHSDAVVRGKTFMYLNAPGLPDLKISCKLPFTSASALELSGVSPTGWGLGKSGWVTAEYQPGDEIPLELLKAWIDESYRAQAPKKLVALIGA